MIKDTNAQTGGLIMYILGIFIIGFFYVAFGAIMDQFQTVNNALIANPNLAYSQAHWNMVDMIFTYWWAYPIIMAILFLVYIIRNSLTKESGYV